MTREQSDLIPYGDFRLDCDFRVGEVKTVDGRSIFGLIWYAGGEAWAWDEYGAALCHARDLAERQELARKTGRTRSGLKVSSLYA